MPIKEVIKYANKLRDKILSSQIKTMHDNLQDCTNGNRYIHWLIYRCHPPNCRFQEQKDTNVKLRCHQPWFRDDCAHVKANTERSLKVFRRLKDDGPQQCYIIQRNKYNESLWIQKRLCNIHVKDDNANINNSKDLEYI